jgi:hypothetical protein
MILEPIHGYDSNDYVLPGAESGAAAAVARQAEQVAVAFYQAGAGHLSIPEVKRASTACQGARPRRG